MLVSAHGLKSATLQTADGEEGRVKWLLFDDEQWVVRYLVVKQGFWIFGKKVLISPAFVTSSLGTAESLTTNLTSAQLDGAPETDAAKPVSRRMEQQFHNYYQIPVYWGGIGLWGSAMTPVEANVPGYGSASKTEVADQIEEEYHLRATREVFGYRVTAMGREIGHIADALIEDNTWAIRYLRIDLNKDAGGGSTYVSPGWVDEITWLKATVALDLEPDAVIKAPKVGDNATLERAEEAVIHDYYRRPRYWAQGGPIE